MHYHCSANFYPSPGKVIEAEAPELAEREYRDLFRVPDTIKVEIEQVLPMPNTGWRRAPPQAPPKE